MEKKPMRFGDIEIQKVMAEKSSFCIHGIGTIKFDNGKKAFAGEIIVTRNSFNHDTYVRVLGNSREFLMPIQSVNSIKWNQRTIE